MNNTGNALLIITAFLTYYAYGYHWLQIVITLFGVLMWITTRPNNKEKKEIELLELQIIKLKKELKL